MSSGMEKVACGAGLIEVPFRIHVTGPSGSGKSELVLAILRHGDTLLEKPIERIMYINPNLKHFGSVNDPFVEALENCSKCDVECRYDMIEECDLVDQINSQGGRRRNMLLIIDDSQNIVNDFVTELFSRVSRHFNISVFFISQNFFEKKLLGINRNLTGIIVMKNYDKRLLQTLNMRLFPRKSDFLDSCLALAEKHSDYPYLYIDFTTSNPLHKFSRIFTRIIPITEMNIDNQFRPIMFLDA